MSGFLRIVTHPRILVRPASLEAALSAAVRMRQGRSIVGAEPGDRHWSIFMDLCRVTGATGAFIPDAYLAAIALEQGAEVATTDRGFRRFPHLRVLHPLD